MTRVARQLQIDDFKLPRRANAPDKVKGICCSVILTMR
jgi:hypothetical protein